MKGKEIEVGKRYQAKVNDRLVTVRVDQIRKRPEGGTHWYVTNLTTGRTTMFRSAVKFKGPAVEKG